MRAILFSKHMCNYVWLWTTRILICTIYTVTCMFLFLSQVKHWIPSCSHEWMQNKFIKIITSGFFCVWWRIVSFKEWAVIHHKNQKRNHSLPPNSAVLLSLPAVFNILKRYTAVCSVCILLPVLGNLTSLINTFEWLKERV